MNTNTKFDQTPFDFKAFNNLTNNTPVGMKLALAISLMNGAWMSYARFNNPLAQQTKDTLDTMKELQTAHKAAQAARAAARIWFNREAIGAQITRLTNKLADSTDPQEITRLSDAIEKLETALKTTPTPAPANGAFDESTLAKLGQMDAKLLNELFQKMIAAQADGNMVAAQNASTSIEQVQNGVMHQQGDPQQAVA